MYRREELSADRLARFERLGWWLGIIAPVLILVGFFVVDQGGTELSGSLADIVDRLTALHGRLVIGNMIGILGAFALVGFAASLRLRLSTGGVQGEWLGSVAFAFGVIMAIGAIVQGWFRMAIAAIVDSGVPADEMLPLWELDSVSQILLWGGVGLVSSMCVSAFTVGLLPKLLGGIGAVLVAATIGLAPTDHGGVSLTLLLWLIVACSLLAVRSDRAIRP